MIRALNTAGLSDLEKRVVKATYDDDEPPKQKHVEGHTSAQRLCMQLFTVMRATCVRRAANRHAL